MFGLTKSQQNDGAIRRTLDALKSNQQRVNEMKKHAEALAPVVRGASPVRLTAGTQVPAFIVGGVLELLPDSPMVDAAAVTSAGTVLVGGGLIGRPDVVAIGNGMMAPLSAKAGAYAARRIRAAIAGARVSAPSSSTASESPATVDGQSAAGGAL